MINDLHRDWQELTQEKIPDYIDTDRSRSIETLLMFGSLSCMSFDTEPLKEEILRRIHSAPKSSYHPVSSLDPSTKNTLKTEGFIHDEHWNERALFLMTFSQRTQLNTQCDPCIIDSLYSQSFFSLLRQIAKRGPSATTPYDMREKFISELEFYMVELHRGKKKAFYKEKFFRTTYYFKCFIYTLLWCLS